MKFSIKSAYWAIFWVVALQMQYTLCQDVCIEGYIMDVFCIDRGTLLDAPTILTLEQPDRHSLHCLVDVSACVNSGFEVLFSPLKGSTTYCRGYRLDQTGNVEATKLARDTGVCSSCTGKGSLTHGFKAVVTGMIKANSGASDMPPTIQVTKVLPATVGCASQGLPIKGADNSCITVSGGAAPAIMAHGSLMLIGWGVLLPTGVVMAITMKHRPDGLWFKLHWILQICGLVLGTVGWIIALVYFNVFKDVGTKQYVHGIIGMLVMILGLLQPINALIRPHPPKDGEVKSPKRRVWEVLHKSGGYSALILAVVNIAIGTTLIPLKKNQIIFQIVYGCTFGYLGLLTAGLLTDKNQFKKTAEAVTP
eukprot:Platyproteum_vivax@DN5463_c0_g1_i1.p1